MGRIADAVLSLLADGPAGAGDLGASLARAGVTRARDPESAVRRATRDDPRVIQIADGRLASVAQALSGVELTTVVTAEAAASGAVEVEPDLAPLMILGVGPTIPLPPEAAAGDALLLRLDDPERRRFSLHVLDALRCRPAEEAALVAAVAERLGRWSPERPWAAPPVTHLATVAASLAAARPDRLRAGGRPLSVVLAEAGYEVHLGWVGPAGTEWGSLTEEEVDALEADVADLLTEERAAEAALAQQRLLVVLRRHLPDRVPAARRLLARTLARAERPAEALDHLTGAFHEDDPEDWYEAAVIAQRSGDEVSARRWVEAGLARCADASRSEVAACLADIGGDLDAQWAFLRLRAGLGEVGPDPGDAERAARAIVGPGRSYLVEAMVEEVLAALPPGDLGAFLAALAEVEGVGREACLAIAAIMPPAVARVAREAAGRGPAAHRPAIAGLVAARPAAAWSTSPGDAFDQRQLVVTVAKEQGRLSPLVALIDLEELGGAVKDAFFLPDMVEPRLRRELFRPMRELGLGSSPIDVNEAIAVLGDALDRTAEIGWRIPSLRHQPVLDRIERWLMRPRRGGAGRRPLAGR